MRNFTGSAEFDDTLPTGEGQLERAFASSRSAWQTLSAWLTKRGKGNRPARASGDPSGPDATNRKPPSPGNNSPRRPRHPFSCLFIPAEVTRKALGGSRCSLPEARQKRPRWSGKAAPPRFARVMRLDVFVEIVPHRKSSQLRPQYDTGRAPHSKSGVTLQNSEESPITSNDARGLRDCCTPSRNTAMTTSPPCCAKAFHRDGTPGTIYQRAAPIQNFNWHNTSRIRRRRAECRFLGSAGEIRRLAVLRSLRDSPADPANSSKCVTPRNLPWIVRAFDWRQGPARNASMPKSLNRVALACSTIS